MFICLVRMRGLKFTVWFAWSGQLDTNNTTIRGGEFAHSHVPSRNLLNAGVRCKMSLAVHAPCLCSGGRCSTMNSSEWPSLIDIMLSLRQLALKGAVSTGQQHRHLRSSSPCPRMELKGGKELNLLLIFPLIPEPSGRHAPNSVAAGAHARSPQVLTKTMRRA